MSDLRAVLVAIQELHIDRWSVVLNSEVCDECEKNYPCPTRRLADEALTARTTKNGDNK
ncbi:hypothetical protein [Glutamicibacter creatinolyticus]|uniref:hypothetical protein n=1 Tax=Glutamicibacter creatinolyticus TaxID=162496 RepID=UPI0032165F42